MKVDLDPKQRAGLYTQLGFLATTATDQAPRSIIRGVHVSLDALCVELPAPPNVPPENPDDDRQDQPADAGGLHRGHGQRLRGLPRSG